MKYLMIREADGGQFPFLFCAPFTHLEVALMLQGQRAGRTIVSAGFVEWRSPTDPRCFGFSESLNLGPSEEDGPHLAAFARCTLDSAKALSFAR